MPKHTPYDGSSHPFGIGLSPLNLENWIEVDQHLGYYLAEKSRLMDHSPDKVWAAEFSSERSQQEALELLSGHLVMQFPEIYSSNGDEMEIAGVGAVNVRDVSRPPLLSAAYLVQEDLVLLNRSEFGWRIVAASVCFPSSWVLKEKIGKVMHDVHAPVPGFGKDTRNAMMIERIFDNLLVDQPVERFNWSVYNDDKLYHADRAGEHFPDHAKGENQYFLRVEHQTLRKLPKTQDILFTIRIHLDPLEALDRRADRKVIAEQFVKTINLMKDEELAYKGLDKGRDKLIARLMEVTQDA